MTFQALSSVVSMEKKVVLSRPRGSIWNTEASVIDNSGILNPKDQEWQREVEKKQEEQQQKQNRKQIKTTEA